MTRIGDFVDDAIGVAVTVGFILVVTGLGIGSVVAWAFRLTLTHLASANPSSAEAQRDVAASLWRLAQLPGGGVRWREVADVLNTMEARGLLAPTDARLAAEARRRAAEEK